jgi:hypothetical protein
MIWKLVRTIGDVAGEILWVTFALFAGAFLLNAVGTGVGGRLLAAAVALAVLLLPEGFYWPGRKFARRRSDA